MGIVESRRRVCTFGLALVQLIVTVAATSLVTAGPAHADNWGSTPCTGTPVNCVSLANNRYHAVRYLSLTESSPNGIPGIAAAMTSILANVYNPTDLNAYHDDADPLPDVLAQTYNYGALNGITAWVDCVPWNTGEGGTDPSRWCRGQYLTFNSYYYWSYSGVYDNDAQRRNVACHELGHTLGLRHRTTTASCMYTYAGAGAAATLDNHDRGHINGYY